MNIGIYNLFDDTKLLAVSDNEWELKIGDGVIFSHDKKKELFGRVNFLSRPKVTSETILDGKILRKATKEDEEKYAQLELEAIGALKACRNKVNELKLAMQALHAIIAFDSSEINFFFTAEERVDFRELVPKLAGVLKKRIHLQQIGVRDRAKLTGGYGICGRELCCVSGVISEFRSITMEMARIQELAMKGTDKLSGSCGKLFCCLSFEVDEYQRLRRGMPTYGSQVETTKGAGKVIGLDILNQMVKLYLDAGGVAVMPVGDLKKGKSASSRQRVAKQPDRIKNKMTNS